MPGSGWRETMGVGADHVVCLCPSPETVHTHTHTGYLAIQHNSPLGPTNKATLGGGDCCFDTAAAAEAAAVG